MEEQVRRVSFDRDVAEFVDDQQVVAVETFEECFKSACAVGLGQRVDPAGGGVEASWVSFRLFCGHGLCGCLLIVESFFLLWRDVAEGFVKTLVVPPIHPPQCGQLDLGD